MLGSAVLELAIGIVFVFLLVSLICSQIGNGISGVLKWRAIELENGIRDLILNGDPAQLERLYNNPLVQSLYRKETGAQRLVQRISRFQDRVGEKPISIPARTFTIAFFDSFVPNAAGVTHVDELLKAVNAMGNSPLKNQLVALLSATNGTIDDARKNVEDWFNGAMDRVTEVYKINMWRLALVIGIIVSFSLNVDTISVATSLWRDPALRTAVSTAASEYEKNASTQADATKELNKLNLPIGWQSQPLQEFSWFPLTPVDWPSPRPPNFSFLYSLVLKIAGCLITGLASAQGAPFWFDLLKKLTQRDTSPPVPV